MNRLCRVVSLCILLSIACDPSPETIGAGAGSADCPGCEIRLVHVATIGAETDLDSPSQVFTPAIDSGGRIFVAPLTDLGTVGVYDATGRFLRTLGRPGEGPGEFRYAWNVMVLPGDTILVFDSYLRRYTIFTPELEPARVVSLDPLPIHVVPLTSDRMFGFTRVAPADSGTLVHEFVGGGATRSFAWLDAAPDVRRNTRYRHLAAAPAGALWLASADRYSIELWDTAGERIRTITAVRDWFPPPDAAVTASRATAPSIDAVWSDADDRLWVLASVPDDDPPEREGPGENYLTGRIRLYDSMIEVLDPATGNLIAALRSDTLLYVSIMSTPGLVTSAHETDSGWIRFELWRLELGPPPDTIGA
jgi:hypothetical protein